jgi:hypothetical protein
MSITTYSAFNYGHTVTEDNQYINFSEDGGLTELGAQIDIGSYSLGDFINKVSEAINHIAQVQEYTVALDRSTRKITISAASNFDLLISSGTQTSISAYSLMGFTGADLTASNSYEGDSASGSQYAPQFLLQRYVDFADYLKTNNVSVNESASGVVEVVGYGRIEYMQCNITLATDIVPQGAINENPTGVADLRAFMTYITTKAPIEIIKDINDTNTYRKALLESTTESKDGTDFRLKELYARKLVGYFETGRLEFRALD